MDLIEKGLTWMDACVCKLENLIENLKDIYLLRLAENLISDIQSSAGYIRWRMSARTDLTFILDVPGHVFYMYLCRPRNNDLDELSSLLMQRLEKTISSSLQTYKALYANDESSIVWLLHSDVVHVDRPHPVSFE